MPGKKENMTAKEKENEENIKASDDEYEDIEDPDFFTFENVGDTVEGELVDVGTSDQYGFGLYTLEKADGDQVRFHGSAVLDSRMKQANIGDYLVIEFSDLEKRPKGDMKLFNVRRKIVSGGKA